MLAGVQSTTQLWSMENGAHITSLKGDTDFFTAVTFSSDSTVLASSGTDGIVRVWDVGPYVAPQQLGAPAKVQLIYFVPRDRSPQLNIRAKLDELIKNVQLVYTNEMERHGFGKKTFDFEKDENGKPVVYRVDGEFTDDDYFKDTTDKVIAEIKGVHFDELSGNVWLIVIDSNSEKIDGVAGKGGSIHQGVVGGVRHAKGSYVLIPASGPGFSVKGLSHELGHAFGLEHDFREHDLPAGSYIMSYDLVPPYRLSKGAAEWLDKSRLFNHNERFFDRPPTIERLPAPTDGLDTMLLRFKLEDVDGLHQVQLAVPTTTSDFVAMVESDLEANPARKKEILKPLTDHIKKEGGTLESLLQNPDYWKTYVEIEAKHIASILGMGWKLRSYQQLKGQETATVEFELTAAPVKEVTLRVIDEGGNIAEREFNLTENSAEQPESP